MKYSLLFVSKVDKRKSVCRIEKKERKGIRKRNKIRKTKEKHGEMKKRGIERKWQMRILFGTLEKARKGTVWVK